MSNDYALFIIHLPNDFDKEISTIPTISQTISLETSRRSVDTVPNLIAPPSTHRPSLPCFTSITDKDNGEHSQRTSTKSLCIALKKYFFENTIKAVWIISDDKKTYQVTFDVEFGVVSDHILQDLVKLDIGRRNDTKISVLPTTIIVGGQSNNKNDSLTPVSSAGDVTHNGLLVNNIDKNMNSSTSNDLTLPRKLRKRISESNFKKSVRARLMVHQVVASIRASTELSFDFVLLICLASMLAAFGLLENSSVIIVASMLVSPLMNPILGIVFGLSVREHSLWKRGCRNELIGLIICVGCGFILGLFTTFAETKWGNSRSFPTPEMKSRGDVKRLWVGVLIALPSGAGVALSVLGGNTGSLVGVAISASLLPPAVNCGLLFAYSLLGSSFASIAAPSLNYINDEYYSNLNCTKYINNDYQPLYKCNLAVEAAILACCSLLLTIVNIICIIIMALFILRIKEVVPLHQPNKDIANFFHHDVKVARDYNKTILEGDSETNNLTTLTNNRNNLAQTIVKRWRTFKAAASHDSQQHQETGQAISISNDIEASDTESRRKLFHLKTFAKEYDLDVCDKHHYDLLSWESREKVRLLVSDLVDMCQEIPPVFIGLFHLQPCNTQTPTDKEHLAFYEEIIELLPPKWHQLFVREQQRREIMSCPSSSCNRTHSLCLPPFMSHRKTISEMNENTLDQSLDKQNKKTRVQRQNSVPERSRHSVSANQETEIPIEGTRFSIARRSTITHVLENKSEAT